MTDERRLPSEGLLDYLNNLEVYLADEQRKFEMLYQISQQGDLSELEQDALERNLQTSTEAVIGLAKNWVKLLYGAVPSAAKESFTYLAKAKVISVEDSKLWHSIVGTRNILVHDYLEIDDEIVLKLLTSRHYLSIFEFAEKAIKAIREIR